MFMTLILYKNRGQEAEYWMLDIKTVVSPQSTVTKKTGCRLQVSGNSSCQSAVHSQKSELRGHLIVP